MSSLKSRNVIRSIFFRMFTSPLLHSLLIAPNFIFRLGYFTDPLPHPPSLQPRPILHTHTHTYIHLDSLTIQKVHFPPPQKQKKKLFRFGIFVKNNLLTPSRSPTPILPKACFFRFGFFVNLSKIHLPPSPVPPALPPQPHPTQKITFRFGFFVKKKKKLFQIRFLANLKKIIPAQKKGKKSFFDLESLSKKN